MSLARLVQTTCLFVYVTLSAVTPTLAVHDSGQGKSQDGSPEGSIATAPEPSSLLLMGSGLGALGLYRHLRSRSPTD